MGDNKEKRDMETGMNRIMESIPVSLLSPFTLLGGSLDIT